jgi:release factor glutamine methyltransferase
MLQTFNARLRHLFLKPFIEWYLKKERHYTFEGIDIVVFPGVFHPGFFHSTGILLDHLRETELNAKSVLELGAGTGLISIFGAKKGAQVIASDIDATAIANIEQNLRANQVTGQVRVITSDLLAHIPLKHYDLILLNPPYYPNVTGKHGEQAWNAGEGMSYFSRLFTDIRPYVSPETSFLMAFPEIASLAAVKKIAEASGWMLEKIREKKLAYETMVLFRVRVKSP